MIRRLLSLTVAWTALIWIATSAFGADVEKMVSTNFLMGRKCSATLISSDPRLALSNYHCIEDDIHITEREEVQKDGTVKKISRVSYDPQVLYQHSYADGKIVGRVELRAEIVAHDRTRDLALLQILSTDITLPAPAQFPPEGYSLKLGQEVWAVGNPIMLENTLTRGILSHLSREFRWETDQVARYIQTDATIAGGSSGGSLWSAEGYLIGVPSAGYRGAALSFAIPYSVVQQFLKERGYAR